MKTIITLTILMLVSLLAQLFIFLPWWSFLLPVFLLGVLLPLEKWKVSSFLSGFIAGFLVWLLSTLYFEAIYEGQVLNKISKLFMMPAYLLYGIIGLTGGVLTGLAFYSGALLRRGKQVHRLELPEI